MIWGVVVTVSLTVLLTAVLSKVGPLDHPRDRGLSSWPTATAGGLAVIAAVVAGLMTFVVLDAPDAGPGLTVWVLASAAVVALLGAVDDVLDFPASIKLVVQVAVAILFTSLVARVEVLPLGPGMEVDLGPVLGVLGTSLWLIVMINAYNFMDGSDGLAVGVQSIGLFALALVNPDRPILAFVLLAAAIANLVFLPYNHPGRRIFQGDCGALFSSFLIAGSTVLLATGPYPRATLYLGVFVAAPFLVDVLLTLLRRARTGRRLFEAHSEHLYQRWIAAQNRTAGALAWRVWALTAACAALGFFINHWNADWSLLALAVLIAALSGLWVAQSARLDRLEATTSG